MNKKEFIAKIAEAAKLPNKDAAAVLEAFMRVVPKSLKKAGDKIVLTGFGNFELVQKPERTARNLQTGEPIIVKAKKVIKFKPSKDLAASVA